MCNEEVRCMTATISKLLIITSQIVGNMQQYQQYRTTSLISQAIKYVKEYIKKTTLRRLHPLSERISVQGQSGLRA